MRRPLGVACNTVAPTLSINARVCEDYPRVAAEARDAWDPAEAQAVSRSQAALHYSRRSASAFVERQLYGQTR